MIDLEALVARGWFLFPLDHADNPSCLCRKQTSRDHDRGKHPGAPWKESASNDLRVLQNIFSNRRRNVGIHCGRSGLLVVDEDRPGGFAQAAEDAGAEIPLTYTVATSKGFHYYFASTDSSLSNSAGKLAGYGIDIRGDGGYVVGPGSQHQSGASYQEVDSAAAVAPLPTWVVAAIGSTAAANTGRPVSLPAVIRGPRAGQPGERHQKLLSYALSLRARPQIRDDEAVTLMRAAWASCEQPPDCTTPFTLAEAGEIFRYAWSKPAGRSLEHRNRKASRL